MESIPFSDAQRAGRQLARAQDALSGIDGQRILRLLTRNTFLLSGIAARLKNPGDNNAWCELVIDDGQLLLASEIEPSGDVLDALRRSLAGCAIVISRYGVGMEEVGAAVVLHRLPNQRVDFYRVLSDAHTRLGLQIFTVPIAVLLLAIRANAAGLAQFIREACQVDDQPISLASAVAAHFGDVGDPALLGLAPSK